MNIRAQNIQQLLNDRSIGPCRRKHQFACVQRRSFYGVGQLQASTVNQFVGDSFVETFRVFFCQIFGKHVVACTGQPVASHASVIFFLVCSLSERSQSDDHVARTDVRIVDHVGTFHAAGNRTVDDDGADQIAYIGRFATGRVTTDSHFAKFG